MKKICLLLLILLSVTRILPGQLTAPLTEQQKSWLLKGNRHDKNGWIYLHIEGTPGERGFQHGMLLANEIKESLRIESESFHYKTALDWQWVVKRAAKMFSPRIDSENLSEIEGIVEGMRAAGVKTTKEEILLHNIGPELWYAWHSLLDTASPNQVLPKKQSCSSFIATGNMTKDGSIVLAHNTMSDYVSPDCNLILDILPDKGNRILMQSVPGLIHSESDFFITSAGLVGSETTIGDFYPYDDNGIPEFARMRRATQYATTIDEWCEIMKKGNNGGYANAWLIGDIKINEIARLELGLKYIGYEKTKNGYYVGSNIAENLQLLRFETKSQETNIKSSSVARRVRWHQLMKENSGKIDIALAKKFESDHYDTYLNDTKPDGRTLCSHGDLDIDQDVPFAPWGTMDGKVVDSRLAKQMAFEAKYGSACDIPFNATDFLEKHPQFYWMKGLLKDRPTQPWTIFKSGENK